MEDNGNIDLKYLNMVNQVLNEGQEKRPVRKNNEGKWEPVDGGVKTLACPNVHFSYDMSHGFPLLTTKKMAITNIAKELEFFIKGITDKRWLKERKCFIWNSWCNQDQYTKEIIDKREWQRLNPDLGPVYGSQWNNFNGEYTPIPFAHCNLEKTLDNYVDEKDDFVGTTYIHEKYGKFIVKSFNNRDKYGAKKYTIKFFNTNGENHSVSKSNIKSLNIKDLYYPSVANVACFGNPNKSKLDQEKYDLLLRSWNQMIHRCYDKNHESYKNYGERGIYVSNRWLVFEYFLEDIDKVPNWEYKLKNWKQYSLDKDLSEQKKYSLESCIWLNRKYQSSIQRNSRPFKATDSKNEVFYSENINEFARDHNLNYSSIHDCLENKRKNYKGWIFEDLPKSYKKGVNQFKNLVKTLENCPSDRRQVVMAWNPTALPYQALPACHLGFVVTVINNKLSLHFTMRSADLGLGVPYNIASYGLLLHLLSKHARLNVGNLSATFCDLHLYENQLSGAVEQLGREPKETPELVIEGTEFDIFDWTHENATLINYDPHEAIKFGDVIV